MGWCGCGLGSGSGLGYDAVATHRHRPQLLGRHEVGEQQRVAAEAALRDALELLHLPALPQRHHRFERRGERAQRDVAWWWKVEHPQLWGGLRRAAEATVSFQAAQAALWVA